MKVIGITGGTGAGKSTVCEELKKFGAEIIDCDKIARQVVEKGMQALKELTEAFGEEILLENGELNRKHMGRIVFSDSEKLARLNEITHKHIFAEMKRRMSVSQSNVVVLDVPLLFQSDFPFECDVTVAVIADDEERLKRIMQRDGIDREAAKARMKSQMTNSEYAELADICFENDDDIMKISDFAKKLCED